MGTRVCDNPTGGTCVPSDPETEICNGLDDDCDGDIDEDIAEEPCTTAPSECQTGFEAPGTLRCVSGELRCESEEGEEYCTICDQSNHCGVCASTPCDPDVDHCIPSHVCAGPGGQEDCEEDPSCVNDDPLCWLPSDTGLAGDHCYEPTSSTAAAVGSSSLTSGPAGATTTTADGATLDGSDGGYTEPRVDEDELDDEEHERWDEDDDDDAWEEEDDD